MLKRTLLATLAVGLIASVGMADVSLHLSPDVVNPADGTQDVSIVMTSNPGTDQQLGAVGFSFDTGSDAWAALDPSAFAWTGCAGDPTCDMTDSNLWFVTDELPDPVAVVFAANNAVPIPDGVDVPIAALTVTPVTQAQPTVFSLSLGANSIADGDGFPLQLKGGDPSSITVLPEPASLSLLMLGALAVVRRRR